MLDFARRRRTLMEALGNKSVLLLPGSTLQSRNGDAHYRFRQNSDFLYLTGFGEPDAFMVLAPGREQPYTLFVRPRDPEREVWDGRRAGVEGAMRDFGADQAFTIGELDAEVPRLLENAESAYFPLGLGAHWDERLTGWLDKVRGLE